MDGAETSRGGGCVHSFLEKSAAMFPTKVAVIFEDQRCTYEELDSKADNIAQWFIGRGLKKGDRVVLLLDNTPEYITAYYGILKAGGVAVPLSTDIKPSGLSPILRELEARFLISAAKFERTLQATEMQETGLEELIIKNPQLAWSQAPIAITTWEEIVESKKATIPALSIGSEELASIIYTSGSTGKPKGVMLSHRNIVVNTRSICRYLNLSAKDVQMVTLPFFYVMGKSLLNTHIATGGTVVLNNKLAFPAAVLNQMVTEDVTGFSGVPSTYAFLLHRSPLAKYRDKLESLRYCSQAGGHMSRFIKTELRKVLPLHTKIYIMYGATEAAARLAYLDPERYMDKMDSIGKAIHGVTLKVLDEDGKELPSGKTGELVCSGLNIMQGYWKDPETTAKVLDRHGYHTGDLAYEDDEGFFYVIGRKDSLIKSGGHRINPLEVEDILMDSENLIEAVVLGVADPILINKLVAVAVPKDKSIRQEDILRHCAIRLPRYKVPSSIHFVKEIPKTSNGKIDRNRCLELLSKESICAE